MLFSLPQQGAFDTLEGSVSSEKVAETAARDRSDLAVHALGPWTLVFSITCTVSLETIHSMLRRMIRCLNKKQCRSLLSRLQGCYFLYLLLKF